MLLGEAAQVLVTEQAVDGGGPGGSQYSFSGMEASQSEDSLDQTQSAHAPFFQSGLGPLAQRRSYALAACEQLGRKDCLGGGRTGGFPGPGGELPRTKTRVDGNLGVTLVQTYQVTIPTHPDLVSQQMQWGGVKGSLDLDVPVGMDGALTGAKEGKTLRCQRLQSRFLDLEKVGNHLTAGGAVNAQPRHSSIPTPEMLIVLGEIVEAAVFQSIGLNVATAPFLLAVLLRIARACGQRREVPVAGEGGIDLIDVRVIETSTHDRCFLVIMAYNPRNTAQVGKGVFVQAERKVSSLWSQTASS
jgi:hypothetical protein